MNESTGQNRKLILAAMVIAFVVSLVGMPSGKVETEVEDFGEPTSAGPA